MKIVKVNAVVILLILMMSFLTHTSFAQIATQDPAVEDANDPVSTSPPDIDDPNNAPIDGGVSLLVAAAIGYGAKKAHAHRKKQKEVEKGENRK
jgi:hypothetical protein